MQGSDNDDAVGIVDPLLGRTGGLRLRHRYLDPGEPRGARMQRPRPFRKWADGRCRRMSALLGTLLAAALIAPVAVTSTVVAPTTAAAAAAAAASPRQPLPPGASPQGLRPAPEQRQRLQPGQDYDYFSSQSWLNGVSCPTATFCAAVGWFGTDNLAELWNGTTWWVAPTPTPNDSANDDILTGVSCTSPTACMAVGWYTVPSGLGYPFAERWDGTEWTLESVPASNGSQLLGVSCASALDCVAVGSVGYSTSTGTTALAELWEGSDWSQLSTANPGSGPGTDDVLRAVSCSSPSSCIAVGYAGSDTLAEEFDGSGWTALDTPNPSSGGDNSLGAVSCPSESACTAVGYAGVSGGANSAFAEVWDGTGWQISPTVANDFQDSYLDAVSCLGATTCDAGGWFFDDGFSGAMVQVLQGTSWTFQYAPNGPSADFNEVYGISCASALSCMLVGASWDPSANGGDGTYVPLVEHWNGTAWLPQLAPQVPPVGGAATRGENPAGGNRSEPQLCGSQGSGGDPCSTVDGAFYQSATDLSLAGRVPLSFTRSYSSVLAKTNGPLGYGWNDDLGASLAVPTAVQTGSTATFTQENGAQTIFTYDGSSWTAAPRVVATLTENSNGTWTLVRGGEQSFQFDAAGQLVAETDPNGQGLAYRYTGAKLTGVTDSSGRRLVIKWSGNHITSVSDPNVNPRRVVRYRYDAAGNLVQVTDVNGGTTDFSYDAAHLMTVVRDPLCTASAGCPGTEIHYDSDGKVTYQTDPLGRKTSFSYSGDNFSPAGGRTTITDPEGNVTVESYQYGLLLTLTKGYGTPEAATWTYRYDPATLGMSSEIDPDGNLTTMSYDASANLTSKTDALGNTTTWTYNSFNEPLTLTDPVGVQTTYTYDAEGNLTEVQTPCSDCAPAATQTTGYSVCEEATCHVSGHTYAEGDLESMTDPDNDTWTYTYDSYGDRTSTTDPAGDKTASAYNADGWLLRTTSPKGNVTGCGCAASFTTTYSYLIHGTSRTDGFGDVQSVTDPLGHVTSYSYDADRDRTSETDPNGNTTAYVYDLDGEQVEVDRADGTVLATGYNADGTIAYDHDGKGNSIETYGYDALGKVISISDALGNVTTYTYDPDGNRLTMVAAGGSCQASPATGCTTYTYDADSQLTSVGYSDGVTPDVYDIGYNADGQRIFQIDGSGSWSWTYNSLHQLTSVTEGEAGTVDYTYDLRGSVLSVTYPDGNTSTRTYDSVGRLKSVSDWLGRTTVFAYDRDSNLVTETLPKKSGIVDTYGYNDADQPTSISDARGTATLFSADYSRDADGEVTSDTSQPAAVDSYSYTALEQLCSAASTPGASCTSPPAGASAYDYDAADNLTDNGGVTQAFNAADQLCWAVNGPSTDSCASPPTGATTYSYNELGQRSVVTPPSGPTLTLDYDQAGNLASYTNGTSTTTYGYNGDGLRMSKKSGKSTTDFAWDLSGSEPVLLAAGKTDYLTGPDGLPVEQITGKTALWYQHDQLGSTRLLTDTSGTVKASYDYGPYGATTASSGTASTSLLFAGQYQDAGSGLYYLQARYYDPATGQFLTVDPAVSGTQAPYRYASDNPVNLTDPTGESAVTKGIGDCEQYENSLNVLAKTVQSLFLLGTNPCLDALGALYLNQTVVAPTAEALQPVTDELGTGCDIADLTGVTDEVTVPCSLATAGISADANLSLTLDGCPVNVTSTLVSGFTSAAGIPDNDTLSTISGSVAVATDGVNDSVDNSLSGSCGC